MKLYNKRCLLSANRHLNTSCTLKRFVIQLLLVKIVANYTSRPIQNTKSAPKTKYFGKKSVRLRKKHYLCTLCLTKFNCLLKCPK